MNATQLLAHFDRLSEAPDAVPRLRRFILDLAVRGKLVEQDAADETASELLKRIRATAAKNTKGKRQTDEPTAVTHDPFSLPNGWTWTRLGEVAQYGISDKADATSVLPANTWVLDLEDIEKETSRLLARIESEARPFSSTKTVFKQGDVLFGKLRPYLNKVIVADQGGVCTTEIIPIRGHCGLVPEYTQLVLRSPLTMNRVDQLMYGMKMPRLGTYDAAELAYPLPPLAEQHRIVAKVDELMALCDQLEAAQQERERRRDRLAAASLQRLNQPAEANPTTDQPEPAEARQQAQREQQKDHARFHLQNLDLLVTRPEQIKAMRQTVLTLAIRGMLVAQIQASSLVSGDSKSKPSAYELPPLWQWKTVSSFTEVVTDGEHATPERILTPQVPLVTAKNVRDGSMDYSVTDWVAHETAAKAWKRCRPLVGDLLLVCVGATTGRLCVLREAKDMVLVRSVALIRPSPEVDADYLAIAIRSPLGQAQIWRSVKVTAQPCLYINRINALEFPVPPLAEQHRIVAKVDELMALCDQLEAQLTQSQTDSRRLLEAVLEAALTPA